MITPGAESWIRTSGPRRVGSLAGNWFKPLTHFRILDDKVSPCCTSSFCSSVRTEVGSTDICYLSARGDSYRTRTDDLLRDRQAF